MPKKYRVKAIWETIQGEGLFIGKPAIFIRMVGCNLWSGYQETRSKDATVNHAHCPMWCDTDFTKENSQTLTAQEILSSLQRTASKIKFCVITGGEPLLQIDDGLLSMLQGDGYFVAIETNGTVPLSMNCTTFKPNWIVCSPKVEESKLNLEYCDELKLVSPDYLPSQYVSFKEKVKTHRIENSIEKFLWIQPEDGPRFSTSLKIAKKTIFEHPEWRLGLQAHKYLDLP